LLLAPEEENSEEISSLCCGLCILSKRKIVILQIVFLENNIGEVKQVKLRKYLNFGKWFVLFCK